ncbi:MAG: SLC13 family permease [Cyclobacteriaceae bacterium]|nr:SLC13 family permease [Cyclobacteriaceae bacterium]
MLVCYGLFSHLIVAFLAFWNDNDSMAFWKFNKDLFLRFLLSALFSSVLFFLGILLAVAALEVNQMLPNLANWLRDTLKDDRLIVTIIGFASAVVDNVPLVAASMSMYSLETYPVDSMLWQYLAYCAGTGGSMLIIGSAAGVAAMGMENIPFGWYLKRIGWLAMVGYLCGALVYLITL